MSLFWTGENFFLPSFPNVRPSGYIFVCRILTPRLIFLPTSLCSIMSDNVLWSLHLSASTSILLFLHINFLLLCLKGIQETPVPLPSALLLRGRWFSRAQPLITMRPKGDVSCATTSSLMTHLFHNNWVNLFPSIHLLKAQAYLTLMGWLGDLAQNFVFEVSPSLHIL